MLPSEQSEVRWEGNMGREVGEKRFGLMGLGGELGLLRPAQGRGIQFHRAGYLLRCILSAYGGGSLDSVGEALQPWDLARKDQMHHADDTEDSGAARGWRSLLLASAPRANVRMDDRRLPSHRAQQTGWSPTRTNDVSTMPFLVHHDDDNTTLRGGLMEQRRCVRLSFGG